MNALGPVDNSFPPPCPICHGKGYIESFVKFDSEGTPMPEPYKSYKYTCPGCRGTKRAGLVTK